MVSFRISSFLHRVSHVDLRISLSINSEYGSVADPPKTSTSVTISPSESGKRKISSADETETGHGRSLIASLAAKRGKLHEVPWSKDATATSQPEESIEEPVEPRDSQDLIVSTPSSCSGCESRIKCGSRTKQSETNPSVIIAGTDDHHMGERTKATSILEEETSTGVGSSDLLDVNNPCHPYRPPFELKEAEMGLKCGTTSTTCSSARNSDSANTCGSTGGAKSLELETEPEGSSPGKMQTKENDAPAKVASSCGTEDQAPAANQTHAVAEEEVVDAIRQQSGSNQIRGNKLAKMFRSRNNTREEQTAFLALLRKICTIEMRDGHLYLGLLSDQR